MSRVRRAAAAAIASAALVLGACGADTARSLVSADLASTTADFSYTIPVGTGDRIDRGETVDIVPSTIDAQVGQVIRIINDDTRGHLIGPFFVGRGETVTQRFTSPGQLRGECSVHPSGALVVNVRR